MSAASSLNSSFLPAMNVVLPWLVLVQKVVNTRGLQYRQ